MPRRVKTPPRHIPPQPSAKDGQRAGPSRQQPSQRDLQQAGPSGLGARQSRRSLSEPRRSGTRSSSSSSSSAADRSYRSPRMSRSRSEQRSTRQTRRGGHLLREITRLQLTTDLLIPKLPFARLIREVLQQYSHRGLRITPEALLCLQESSEIYLVQMFEDAYRCTLHRDRVTLMPKDMNLALYLRERWAR
uniref:Putative histone H3.3 type 2 n=1 Tax=Culex tarsalis TaxID=7177 RepID=A0A1Q3EWP2_CULTA